jgi:colanic acid/amylovoran biosynthesis protein
LSFEVLTKTSDYDALRLQPYRAQPITDCLTKPPQTRSEKLRAKISRLYRPPSAGYKAVVDALKKASVVIASGGDVFSSDYGALQRHLLPLEIALNAGVPVVFLAQSIGPFKQKSDADAWTAIARRCQLITVREKISYNYITEDLGLSKDLVKFTADPAFLLAPSSPEQVASMLGFYGIKQDRPIIALGVSQGISRYAGCNYDQHLKAWYEVVQLLLNELDAEVVLVPHVQEIAANNDDRILATNLIRLLDFNPRVHLMSADHSASEFKGLISACDLVISERMHAAIAGLSSGVCTIAVGYSIKAEGIMVNLLGEEPLKNGLLIPIQQFLDPDAIRSSIHFAWKQRQEIVEQLQATLPQIKQNSASNFDMISQLLG